MSRVGAPRLLVTGFGPFPGMPRNPSGDVAARVAALPRWRIGGIAVTCRVLPTTYAALDTVLDPLLARDFDAILMVGVAGRARRVRVEERALDRISVLFPDASGHQPDILSSRARALVRRTSVDPGAALVMLRRAGIDAIPSRDAGRYLCNAAYFRGLAKPVPVLFMHIPKPPRVRPSRLVERDRRLWGDRLAFGFAAVAQAMLTRSARSRAMQRRPVRDR